MICAYYLSSNAICYLYLYLWQIQIVIKWQISVSVTDRKIRFWTTPSSYECFSNKDTPSERHPGHVRVRDEPHRAVRWRHGQLHVSRPGEHLRQHLELCHAIAHGLRWVPVVPVPVQYCTVECCKPSRFPFPHHEVPTVHFLLYCTFAVSIREYCNVQYFIKKNRCGYKYNTIRYVLYTRWCEICVRCM